jgi:hypothetical protein
MPTDATLGATVREALRLAALMKADGVPHAEIDATLERTLRAAWPFVREWKYLCSACGDCGARWRCCPETPCERQQPHAPHSYVMPCVCTEGARYVEKPKQEQQSVKRRGHVRAS